MNGKCGDVVYMILLKKFLNKKISTVDYRKGGWKDDRNADFGNSSS